VNVKGHVMSVATEHEHFEKQKAERARAWDVHQSLHSFWRFDFQPFVVMHGIELLISVFWKALFLKIYVFMILFGKSKQFN